jgi:tetratricopeptide (TPR) repeat protein
MTQQANRNEAWQIFLHGRIYQEKEDFHNALSSFNQVLNLYPEHNYAKVTKGCVLARLNRMDESIQTFDELIHSYWDSDSLIDKFRVLAALNNKAYHLLQKGRTSEALASLADIFDKFNNDSALEIRYRAFLALKSKITLLEMTGNQDDAISLQRKYKKELQFLKSTQLPHPPQLDETPIAKLYTELTKKADLDEAGTWVEELEKILDKTTKYENS